MRLTDYIYEPDVLRVMYSTYNFVRSYTQMQRLLEIRHGECKYAIYGACAIETALECIVACGALFDTYGSGFV